MSSLLFAQFASQISGHLDKRVGIHKTLLAILTETDGVCSARISARLGEGLQLRFDDAAASDGC